MFLFSRTKPIIKPAPTSRHDALDAHFFLPNLCSITALLPLILVGELIALALTVSASQLPAFDWVQFSLLSTEILWVVLTGAACLCRMRPLLKRLSPARGVALCFVTLIVDIAVIAAAGQWMLSYLAFDWISGAWAVLQHITVGGILAGLVLRYFYLQQQLHIQQQAQLQATMQARFQALQSRIRPHFLFNSMNIIASLIDSDPDMAERVVEDMSELFRASLSDVEDLVPLARELSLCECYINIEQLRLGERLRVNWQKQLQHEQYLVPSLCLQPLIENAIYHGIQPLVEGGDINIAFDDIIDSNSGDARLTITISNPFTADTDSYDAQKHNGMALDNLEQRLHARYGTTATFSVTRDGGLFVVRFSIPAERRDALPDIHKGDKP